MKSPLLDLAARGAHRRCPEAGHKRAHIAARFEVSESMSTACRGTGKQRRSGSLRNDLGRAPAQEGGFGPGCKRGATAGPLPSEPGAGLAREYRQARGPLDHAMRPYTNSGCPTKSRRASERDQAKRDAFLQEVEKVARGSGVSDESASLSLCLRLGKAR